MMPDISSSSSSVYSLGLTPAFSAAGITYSVKRSDVTGNRFYVTPPPPYFIVLASSVTTMKVKAIEFHRQSPNARLGIMLKALFFLIL